MTMIWCLSPLIGFFLTPVMGSLSDRCGSSLGRRRPFIIILSVGVILGTVIFRIFFLMVYHQYNPVSFIRSAQTIF